MIPFNPWWIHHCAGNLDPENDPYSNDYKSPICGVSTIQMLLTLFIFFIYTGLYGLVLYYIITKFLLTNNIFISFISFILFLIVVLIYVTLLIITLDKILKMKNNKEINHDNRRKSKEI